MPNKKEIIKKSPEQKALDRKLRQEKIKKTIEQVQRNIQVAWVEFLKVSGIMLKYEALFLAPILLLVYLSFVFGQTQELESYEVRIEIPSTSTLENGRQNITYGDFGVIHLTDRQTGIVFSYQISLGDHLYYYGGGDEEGLTENGFFFTQPREGQQTEPFQVFIPNVETQAMEPVFTVDGNTNSFHASSVYEFGQFFIVNPINEAMQQPNASELHPTVYFLRRDLTLATVHAPEGTFSLHSGTRSQYLLATSASNVHQLVAFNPETEEFEVVSPVFTNVDKSTMNYNSEGTVLYFIRTTPDESAVYSFDVPAQVLTSIATAAELFEVRHLSPDEVTYVDSNGETVLVVPR